MRNLFIKYIPLYVSKIKILTNIYYNDQIFKLNKITKRHIF